MSNFRYFDCPLCGFDRVFTHHAGGIGEPQKVLYWYKSTCFTGTKAQILTQRATKAAQWGLQKCCVRAWLHYCQVRFCSTLVLVLKYYKASCGELLECQYFSTSTKVLHKVLVLKYCKTSCWELLECYNQSAEDKLGTYADICWRMLTYADVCPNQVRSYQSATK